MFVSAQLEVSKNLLSYSDNDLICGNYVRDIRLGNLVFDSVDIANSIVLSVCCD